MARTRKRRAKRSAEEWSALIAEWRRSGKTAAAFAEEHDLCRSSLYGWASKLRDEVERQREAFVPIRVVGGRREEPEQGARPCIELVTRSGRMLRVVGPVDAEALSAVLEVAERC